MERAARRAWAGRRWAEVLGLAVAGLVSGGADAAGQTPNGEALVRSLGCGGCHRGIAGGEEIRTVAPAFGPDGTPVAAAFVFTYLADPVRRRPGITPARMPDFRLSERERLALALFLAGEPEGGAAARARERHADLTAADGERAFRAFNCAACHGGTEVEPWADGPDLSREGARVRAAWLRAYLAEPTALRPSGHRPGLGSRMPDFRLTGTEVEAISGHLLSLSSPPSAPAGYDRPLSAFGARRTERLLRNRLSCLGCHSLEGDGGRIAPALDRVGRRLTPGWVDSIVHRPRETVPGTLMPRPLFDPGALDEVARLLLHREGSGGAVPEGLGPLQLPTWTVAGMAGGDSAPDDAPPGGNVSPPRGDAVPEDATGAALYRSACAHCHGAAGEGDGWNARFLGVTPTPHASDSLMGRRPDDTLFDGIWAGAWVLQGSNRMPAFGGSLSRDQIRSLVDYIRELCDCVGPAWSRDGRGG